jgi:hypothetical protein
VVRLAVRPQKSIVGRGRRLQLVRPRFSPLPIPEQAAVRAAAADGGRNSAWRSSAGEFNPQFHVIFFSADTSVAGCLVAYQSNNSEITPISTQLFVSSSTSI